MEMNHQLFFELLKLDFGGCLIFCSCIMDGREYRGLIDSGANMSFMRSDLLVSSESESAFVAKGIGDTPEMKMFQPERIQIAGTVLTDFVVFKRDFSDLHQMMSEYLLGEQIDGILGSDLLRSGRAVFSPTELNLRFFDQDIKVEEILYPAAMKHYFVRMEIEGKACSLILDTGASNSLFDEAFCEMIFENTDAEWLDVEGTVAGIGKNMLPEGSQSVDGFYMGGQFLGARDFLQLNMSHINEVLFEAAHKTIDFVIGNDILGTFVASLNYVHQKIELRNLPAPE